MQTGGNARQQDLLSQACGRTKLHEPVHALSIEDPTLTSRPTDYVHPPRQHAMLLKNRNATRWHSKKARNSPLYQNEKLM
jgi:hypothetical protein